MQQGEKSDEALLSFTSGLNRTYWHHDVLDIEISHKIAEAKEQLASSRQASETSGRVFRLLKKKDIPKNQEEALRLFAPEVYAEAEKKFSGLADKICSHVNTESNSSKLHLVNRWEFGVIFLAQGIMFRFEREQNNQGGYKNLVVTDLNGRNSFYNRENPNSIVVLERILMFIASVDPTEEEIASADVIEQTRTIFDKTFPHVEKPKSERLTAWN